jgi:hypothetical protein
VRYLSASAPPTTDLLRTDVDKYRAQWSAAFSAHLARGLYCNEDECREDLCARLNFVLKHSVLRRLPRDSTKREWIVFCVMIVHQLQQIFNIELYEKIIVFGNIECLKEKQSRLIARYYAGIWP